MTGEEKPPVPMQVRVPRKEYDYLVEWAEAVGCSVEDVAADAISIAVSGKIDD